MSNRDRRLKKEAQRLIRDMMEDLGLTYLLFSKAQSINDDDQDNIAYAMSVYIQRELSYNTDWDHFREAFLAFEKSSLDLWKGTYYLASEDRKIHRMKIASRPSKASLGSSDEEPEILVYLNGISLEKYTFENKVLSWELPAAPKGSTKGTLTFYSYIDQLIANDISQMGDYVGPYIEGGFIAKKDQALSSVKGKTGVYSYPALRGNYGDIDSLNYWAGTYLIYTAEKGEAQEIQAELVIMPSEEGQKNKIFLNADPLDYDLMPGNQIVWSVRRNNIVVNNNAGRLNLVKSPNNKKAIAGHIRLEGAPKVAPAGGMQTEKGGGDPEKLEIMTNSLPSRNVGEIYTKKIQAKGGKPPYTWKIEGLPKGLNATENEIGGTPEVAGLFQVEVNLTDQNQEKVNALLDLILNESTKSSGSSTSTIMSWITAGAGLLFGAIAAIVSIVNRSSTNKIEEKKLEVARDALNEKVEARINEATAPLEQGIAAHEALQQQYEEQIEALEDMLIEADDEIRGMEEQIELIADEMKRREEAIEEADGDRRVELEKALEEVRAERDALERQVQEQRASMEEEGKGKEEEVEIDPHEYK